MTDSHEICQLLPYVWTEPLKGPPYNPSNKLGNADMSRWKLKKTALNSPMNVRHPKGPPSNSLNELGNADMSGWKTESTHGTVWITHFNKRR